MIGNKLRAQREAHKITLEQLADTLGIDTSTLSRIETNKVKPKRIYIDRIAKALDVDPMAFYEEDVIDNLTVKNSLLIESSNSNSSYGIPLEFVEKLLDRIERMNEHMLNTLKQSLNNNKLE